MDTLAIRADASEKLGIGHLMRCLALAEHFDPSEVTFYCSEVPTHLQKKIQDRGHRFEKLKELESPLPQSHSLLIVDHYKLDAKWEKEAKKKVHHILVLDDLENRPHFADFIVDQNYSRKKNRYDGLVPASCKKFLGPEFAILRSEFSKARKTLKRKTGELKRVVIAMGGTDPTGQAIKILSAVKPFESKLESIDIVTTQGNPHLKQLLQAEETSKVVHVHMDSPEYVQLLTQADLAIGAGGTSTWERLCLGLPSLQLALFDNQEPATRDLDQDGFVVGIVDSNPSETKINEAYKTLLSLEKRDFLSHRGMQLVDGMGGEKVARVLRDTL